MFKWWPHASDSCQGLADSCCTRPRSFALRLNITKSMSRLSCNLTNDIVEFFVRLHILARHYLQYIGVFVDFKSVAWPCPIRHHPWNNGIVH